MHRTTATYVLAVVLWSLVVLLRAPTLRAEMPRTIPVVASGSASASPIHVLLLGNTRGQGDMGEAAVEKHRAAKADLEKIFGEGKLEKVSWPFGGEMQLGESRCAARAGGEPNTELSDKEQT